MSGISKRLASAGLVSVDTTLDEAVRFFNKEKDNAIRNGLIEAGVKDWEIYCLLTNGAAIYDSSKTGLLVPEATQKTETSGKKIWDPAIEFNMAHGAESRASIFRSKIDVNPIDLNEKMLSVLGTGLFSSSILHLYAYNHYNLPTVMAIVLHQSSQGHSAKVPSTEQAMIYYSPTREKAHTCNRFLRGTY